MTPSRTGEHQPAQTVVEIWIVLLRDGSLLKQGSKAEVLTDTLLSATFGMPVCVERHGEYFSAAEKLRIVKKADACIASGERGALEAMLREEGLYSYRSFVTARTTRQAGGRRA